MKFALVCGKKTEASRGARGVCQCCGSELIAKCGEVKINHWAHKGIRNCDIWWENETEWHRSWKNHFPVEWQEVIQFADSGEKHIADIKTSEGWVIEFQHSYLQPEERRSRNAFCKKLVWVIDGLRRERDKSQFQNAIREGSQIKLGNVTIICVSFPEEVRLLKEWLDSRVPVFFDFNESRELMPSTLWYLLPKMSNNRAYLIPISGNEFIRLNNGGGFDELAYEITTGIRDNINRYERHRSSSRITNSVLQKRYRKPYRKPL